MRKFRLATVLRARKVQEDVARGAVLRARADAQNAAAEVNRQDVVMSELGALSAMSAGRFSAALYARQGMAAELSAARTMAAAALGTVQQRLSDLTDASVRRRGVEKLAERHAADARVAEEAAAQLELDDLTTTSRTRVAPGVDA